MTDVAPTRRARPPASAPTVTTPTSASITTSGATLGGNVTSNGGATLTERGVVYALTATNSNPQISGTGGDVVIASGALNINGASLGDLVIPYTDNYPNTESLGADDVASWINEVSADSHVVATAANNIRIEAGDIKAFDHQQKHLATFFFVTDPDGYKIEFLQRQGRYL